nr:immunoglobulin light chain junction region [Macaca mulatta]
DYYCQTWDTGIRLF